MQEQARARAPTEWEAFEKIMIGGIWYGREELPASLLFYQTQWEVKRQMCTRITEYSVFLMFFASEPQGDVFFNRPGGGWIEAAVGGATASGNAEFSTVLAILHAPPTRIGSDPWSR